MMLRGIRGLGDYTVKSSDSCLNLNTYQPASCSGPIDDLLCMDQGFPGRCSTQNPMTRRLIPIMTLQNALQYCNNQVGCQVISAAPCDPVFVAAGFQNCSQQGLLSFYTLGQANLTGPNQYNAPVTANTAGGLTYQAAQWLAAQGLINPVSSPTQTITPTYAPISPTAISTPPPTSTGWAGSAGGSYGTTIYQPTYQPIAQPVYTPPPTQAPTQAAQPAPNAQVLPVTAAPTTSQQAPAMMPGSNTAQTLNGQYSPTAAPQSAPAGGEMVPGLSNNTLYLAVGALALLMVLKK